MEMEWIVDITAQVSETPARNREGSARRGGWGVNPRRQTLCLTQEGESDH